LVSRSKFGRRYSTKGEAVLTARCATAPAISPNLDGGMKRSVTAHRIPHVRAAAVVPGKDPLAGAALVAVSDAQPHEVLEALRVFLPGSKMPSRCLVVDSLPRTERGKVDRVALAEVVR
jgi:acyl-CoA synthetase (AMP-forming)/AMP-acid ligase II